MKSASVSSALDRLSRYPLLPSFRIGAYTLGAASDVIRSRLWALALGADLTFYTKPSTRDSPYGKIQCRSRFF